MIRTLFFLLCLLVLQLSFAQHAPLMVGSTDDTVAIQPSPYKINTRIELPVTVAGFLGTYLAFPTLYRISNLSTTEIAQLNRFDVNRFDRPIIDEDPELYSFYRKRSDTWINATMFSPLLLLLDPKARRDGWKYVTLYGETQMLNTVVYQIAAFLVRRPRPFAYNETLTLAERSGDQGSNSFFSGHVSTVATASFFTAKAYTDYHQIKGWKRLVLYGIATVPPSVVGIYRMKAGKHFRSDIIVGLVTGGIMGIMIPELHRRAKRKKAPRPL